MEEKKYHYLIEKGSDFLVFKGEKPNTIVFVFASWGTQSSWLDEVQIDLTKFSLDDIQRLSMEKEETVLRVVEKLKKNPEELKW